MRRSALWTISALFIFVVCLCSEEAFSRGGFRGGGFGGGGGFGRGFEGGGGFGGRGGFEGRSFEGGGFDRFSGSEFRSSYGEGYSRPVRQPQAPRQVTRPPERPIDRFPAGGQTARPSRSELQQFLNLPQHTRGGGLSDLGKLGAAGAAGALGAVGAERMLDRRGEGDRPGLGDRPGFGDRPGIGERPSTLPERAHADQIRDNIHGRYDHAFSPEWWRNHPNIARARWDDFDRHHWNWNHWWRPATWAAIGAWVAGADWGSPVNYDYGNNIYYEGDQVYQGGLPIATAQEYYDQAGTIASSAPPAQQTDADWMPLGVFALGQGQATDSNTLLQLAVNKQGVIEGTYYNTATDTARPVKGMVDKKTQRAAWTFSDGQNQDIVMETGIYNLTQDQTEILVHFGQDQTQQWLMVRLQQPGQDAQPAQSS